MAAPAVQQTTVVPMQVPVPTASGQTLYQTIHVPIQSLGGCGVGGLNLGGVATGVGMGGVAQVAGMLAHAGQPVALQQLAGLTGAPQAQLAQIQVHQQQQQSSPTTPSSVGTTVSTANGNSTAASQAQAVQQVQQVQSMQQWAADAATAAALAQAQAQAQAAQVAVHQQHQTVALQLPNGQIVQGQQVNLGGGATMVYPGGGGMNMAAAAQLAAAGLRSQGVIQLANLNGVPVQIQGTAAGQQQLQQLLQGNAALQALGLQTTTGPLSPLQTIQIAGTGGQQIVAQQLQQDPNDPTRWQVVQVPQTVAQAQAQQATHVAVSQAATCATVTPTTVTVQATPQQLQAATTAAAAANVNGGGDGSGGGNGAAGGNEAAPQQIVLVATGGGEVVTASAATPSGAGGGNGPTATIAPVTSATGTPLATGERRLRRVACTCPNCRDGDGHRTIRPNGEGPGRRQHICHIAGCHKVYGKTSHLRAHLR